MKKTRCMRERICAVIMAFLVLLTGIIPNTAFTAHASEIPAEPKTVKLQVLERQGEKNVGVPDVEVSICEDQEVIKTLTTNGGGYTDEYTIENPNPDASYTWKTKKTGYTDGSGAFAENGTTVVNLSMAEIELSASRVDLVLGDPAKETATVTVKNQIGDGTSYMWTVPDTSIVMDKGAGNLKAVGRGRTSLIVSRYGKEKQIDVVVKEELTDMALQVAPGTDGQSTQDQDSVTITVDGMETAKGDVEVYANGRQIGTARASEGYSFTYTDANVIKGKVTFKAVYKPDVEDYYLEKTVTTSEISYKKAATLNLVEKEKKVSYGTDEAIKVDVTAESKNSGNYTYESDNTSVATVDSAGKITITGAGTANIIVTAAEDDVYLSARATYKLTVEQKKVTIQESDIVWDAAVKVYDGKSTIDLTGSAVADGETFKIPVSVEIMSGDASVTDVGSYQIAKVVKIGNYNSAASNYTIDLQGVNVADAENNISATILSGLDISVTRRPVYVQVKRQENRDFETSVPYGTSTGDIRAAAEQNETELAGTNGQIDTAVPQGLAAGDDVSVLNLKENTAVEWIAEIYYVGTYEAIKPVVKKKQVGNYELCVAENTKAYYGRLQITQQVTTDEEIWENIRVDEENSENVYLDQNQETGTIWVSAGSRLALSVKDTTYYDTVNLKKENDPGYSSFLTFGDALKNKNTDVIANIYLSKEGQATTRTIAKDGEENGDNKIPASAVKVDNRLPVVTFASLGNFAVVSALPGAPTFRVFAKEDYTETVAVSDDGSGIKESVFKIVTVTDDQSAAAVIQGAAVADDGWTALSETNQIPMPVPEEGAYQVILIRATDQVGNRVISCSNGIVLDMTPPVVDLVIREEKEVYGTDGVDYSITVSEPDGILSGVGKIQVQVTVDGEVIPETQDESSDTVKHVNTYTLEKEELDKLLLGASPADGAGYTIAQLQKKKTYVIADGKIDALTCGTSNHVKLTVTAYDMAGNEMPADTREMKFDVTNPEVTVSYDENNPKTTEDEKGGYFRNRSMTITYEEQNYNPEKATFELTVNGEEQTGVNINNIGAIPSISVETLESVPTEPGVDAGDLHTYRITFGGEEAEYEYKIIPHIEDMSGNVNQGITYADGTHEKSKTCFVVDQKVPTVEVSYDDKNDPPITENEKGGYFQNRSMTIIYIEHNYDAEKATFDLMVDGVERKNINIDNIGDIPGISVEKLKSVSIEPEIDPKDVYAYKITFGEKNKEYEYEIIPHIEDKSGNKNQGITYVGVEEEVLKTRFVVDQKAPQISVSYDNNDAANDFYFKADRVMTITYTERNFMREGLTFDVTVDGTEQKGVSLDSLTKDFEDKDISVESGLVDDPQGTDMKKLTIRFGNRDELVDRKFVIKPHIQDKAANQAETVNYARETIAPEMFVIDEIAPVLNVEYTANGAVITPGSSEQERIYESVSSISAKVTITEHNFSQENAFADDQMQVSYKAVNAKGEPVKMDEDSDYTKNAKNTGFWTDDLNHVGTFIFVEDANYQFGLEYTDLAGNKAVHNTRYFTVDDTAPTGTIYTELNGKEGLWDSWYGNLTFGFFNKADQVVKLTSDDQTAGVKSTQYYKYIPGVETRGEFAGLSIEELKQIKEWIDGSTVMVNREQQAVIYEKIVDLAGNVTYINAKEGVIVDDTDPVAPEITITTAQPAQDIYAGDVNFSLHVTDPVSGGTYAGLKEVYYEIRNNGKVTQSGNYNGELSDHTARRQSMTKSETVKAQLNNSNFVQIYVRAVDYAGNESEATKDIKIDITAPEVTITFDNNNPLNGSYYKDTRTATISVRERNFDPNAVHLSVSNSDGTPPSISGWSISPQAGMTDDAINTCTVTFSADGDYNMSMYCSDKAGNSSNTATVEEFTVDKTLPTISISFDNNESLNGRYYNAPRRATITIVEHNFNAAEVQTAIRAMLEAQGITAPPVNGWAGSGDTHTATIYFQQDGDYSFTVNYTDLAGNVAQTSTVELFTVDQTKPVIEIFDIEDKSANNGVVAPGVRYSDVNHDIEGVSITIQGPNHPSKEVDGSRSSIPNGQSIKMADFAHEEAVDDIYTLKAVVTDYAGNSDEQTVTFSVNRFGSNYVFGDETKELLDQYYAKEEQDLVVTEINVDTLDHYGISYGRDGELVNLTQGTDYTLRESGNDVSWKSYTYTIKAENFAQEGMYDVTIDSRDRATNEVNNKIKEANIEFVIDKTAPTVVVTGIENDKQYRAAERDMTVSVADNVAIGDMDIYLDSRDESVQGYDAETIQKQNGEVSYTLGSSSKWQSVNVVVRDAAGNMAQSENIRVLITTNILIQFVRNTPLLIGTCIAAAAVIIFIILLAKKRKKEQKAA